MAHMLTTEAVTGGRPPASLRHAVSKLWSLIMAIYDDADVNPPRPASGHEYKDAMRWLHDETQFACEGCGDLVTLEKAKLRDDIRDLDKAWNGLRKRFKR
jgi:hypothetical protein